LRQVRVVKHGADAVLEQGSKANTHSAKMQKAPEGAFLILAERVAIFSHPKDSEEIQNSFEVLHLAKSVTTVKRGNPAEATSQT